MGENKISEVSGEAEGDNRGFFLSLLESILVGSDKVKFDSSDDSNMTSLKTELTTFRSLNKNFNALYIKKKSRGRKNLERENYWTDYNTFIMTSIGRNKSDTSEGSSGASKLEVLLKTERPICNTSGDT